MNSYSGSLPAKDKKKLSGIVKSAAVLVTLIAGVFILHALQDILIPLLFSVLVSILLFPVCDRLERWKFPRVLAITLSLLLFIVVIVGLLWLVTIQVGSFAEELPQTTEKAEALLEQLTAMGERYFNVSRSEQVSRAKGYLVNALGESRAVLLSTLVATTGTLATAALLPLYVFFFLLYRDFFRQFVHKAFDNVPKFKLNTILDKIYSVIQSYLVGLVLVIFIVGILNTVGLMLLGIDHAIFFGFLAAFLILIPYIGILIGSIFPALMAIVTKDSAWYAVGVIGVMSTVQFLEGNFITPNIVGSKVSINPLAAIVMLLLGGALWGLPGLVLALPLTAILKVIFDANKSTLPYGFLLGEPEHEVAEEKMETERDQVREIRDNRHRDQPQRDRTRKQQKPRKEKEEVGFSSEGRGLDSAIIEVPEKPMSIANEALEGTDLVLRTESADAEPKKRRRPARRRKPRPTSDTVEGNSETPKNSGDQDS